MEKTTRDSRAEPLNKQQLAYVQQLRRLNRRQNAKRATGRVLQAISPFLRSRRKQQGEVNSKTSSAGRNAHANSVPGPNDLSCTSGAQIGLQRGSYSYGSSAQPTLGPLAYTDNFGDEFYRWAALTHSATGEAQISMAALTYTFMGESFEGDNSFFGISYTTVNAGFTQLFTNPSNSAFANLAATARLTAPQVLPSVGVSCDIPDTQHPNDLTVAILTGSCTVTVSPAEIVLGGGTVGSTTGEFLDLQEYANSTGYTKGSTFSALDTPATGSQYNGTGLQGFLDVTANVSLPTPLDGSFLVDVDIALTCSYYSSNKALWGAGAYADLQNADLEIPPLPYTLFPAIQSGSSITVGQILLCGEVLARGPPPKGRS
jgi:hypothetical protein